MKDTLDWMMINMNYVVLENELQHYGIKGQKWGVRRFQNEDGSLTAAGKDRYQAGKEFEREREKIEKEEKEKLAKTFSDLSEDEIKSMAYKRSYDEISRRYGNTAIDDIKYYRNGSSVTKWIARVVGGGITLASVALLIGGKIIGNSIKKQINS